MFNMKQCKPGDKLFTKHGLIVTYVVYNPLEHFPHQIEYPNGAYGSRTDEGYVYNNNRLEDDEDIIGFVEVKTDEVV